MPKEERDRAHLFETLRDPSHAAFVDISQLQSFFRNATPKLRLVTEKRKTADPNPFEKVEGIMGSRDNRNSLKNWLDLTNTSQENRKLISGAIEKELEGKGAPTGMKPFRDSKDGTIYFIHKYVTIEADRV